MRDERRDEIDKKDMQREMEQSKKNIKINIKFFQKRAEDCCIQSLLETFKSEKNNFYCYNNSYS